MPKRLLLALILLIAAPLVLLGWMSARTFRDQEVAARRGIDLLFQNQLATFDRAAIDLFARYEKEFSAALDQNDPVSVAKSLPRTNPVVRAVLVADGSGNLLYPPPNRVARNGQGSEPASIAYTTMQAIVQGRPSLQQADNATAAKTKGQATATDRRGWQVWFMDEGMQLIYWKKIASTSKSARPLFLGTLLERSRWVSDLTVALPDSGANVGLVSNNTSSRKAFGSYRSNVPSGFTALVDPRGQIVYRWGDQSEQRKHPIASRALPEPLTNWRFDFHADDPIPVTSFLPTLLFLSSIGTVFLALGVYVLTSIQRRMREAQSRVSFASQVSHELRTPLTNVRLYAELAQSDLNHFPNSDEKVRVQKRLSVIDTESRRLGRLVSGVLEVIRGGDQEQSPRLALLCPDDVIDQTIAQFEPSFQTAGITVHRQRAAKTPMLIDGDLLEMILVNLLGNVEKYAASGGQVTIQSTCTTNELTVDILDLGPGIQQRHWRRVFEPFTRLDNSISAPSGTGIGLTIARKMAKRHNGSLHLIPADRGAHFRLCLANEKSAEQRKWVFPFRVPFKENQ